MSFFPSKRHSFIFLVFPIILLGIVMGSFLIIIHLNKSMAWIILLGFILSIIMLLISFLYGIYPLFIKSEKFFTRREYSNITLEFEFIKKFLFIIVVIITILNIYYLFDPRIVTSITGGTTVSFVLFIQAYLGLLTFVAFLRIITILVKKEFRIYYAKGCCEIISEKKDEFDKIKFLSLMLNSYNKYIKRNLQLEINSITKIHSTICYKDPKERNQIIKSICDCINIEDDKLNLSRYLSTIYEIPRSDFFVKRSILADLKIVGAILATAIPIIISLLPIFTQIIEEIQKRF